MSSNACTMCGFVNTMSIFVVDVHGGGNVCVLLILLDPEVLPSGWASVYSAGARAFEACCGQAGVVGKKKRNGV